MIKITVGPGQVSVEGDSPELVAAIKDAIIGAVNSPATKLQYKVAILPSPVTGNADEQAKALQELLDKAAPDGWCFDALQGSVVILAKRA